MWNWFAAGGFGMFMVLAAGVGAIGYGVKSLRDPSAARLATLKSLPGLVAAVALFTFGVNVWAVNKALESGALLEHGFTKADLPLIGLVGFTEAAQPLTLAALLSVVVIALGIATGARQAKLTA